MASKKSILIICGGGPAPGINAVISTVAKIFLKDGYRVLGLHEGFKGIFSEEPQIKEFDFAHADRIFSRGGSTLIMSRFKPSDEKINTKLFSDNNVKLLVSIGGDDTASTANRITGYLLKENISISNIHVPKTIDNDLPLPDRNPTFGFHSAKDEGVRIGNTTYEDARTSQNWFVMSTMGRSAGHLAFGIAASCHFPMMVIPEMFNQTPITFDKVVRLIISSIVKRKIKNINYGVALVSEGVFHIMPDSELDHCGINFTYDDHGHPELGNVSKSHIFNMLVQVKLKELGIHIKSRPVELGYELRCCRPIGFDLTLCTLLGIGVKKLFDQGLSGCIVTANSRGEVTPLFLEDLQGEDGKIAPRLVEVDSEFARLFFQNMHYIEESDYEAAKAYLPDPESYDFNKILSGEV
ncbi:6-phosphofructokinase [Zobellia galactanivorans]|uniref:Diphosphate-fructose-6-phosphate 1-phosphotransferase n=1 Tax=Zobellia galactanivorans (strain DSM 12802 / CCUG 47099 / CIP 106680 / NCIMB 13871 / Dsij) TaxID=63186 RepID=G0L677_ZOBGA|nr:6-phosphofructokinase [Zobellia galactanivorans]MBU3027615.1 6-phosphofructokinase [Zobellia galactanivorans]MDO6806996.1 6-phosphofructokinase [Zobellia galactanivorans]CAZ96763.1 Diphosphate-fructose-6-phosphate 1-phosphotransferase [Zobellia galactanivorans]